MWQFLLELLKSKQHENIIQWTNNDGEFKLLNPEEVAHLWGIRKNKKSMNYDKLSRALRYYYEKNIIKKVMGQKFVYRFVSYPDIEHSVPENFDLDESINSSNKKVSSELVNKDAVLTSAIKESKSKSVTINGSSGVKSTTSRSVVTPSPVSILPTPTSVNILQAQSVQPVSQQTLQNLQLMQLSSVPQVPQTLLSGSNVNLCYLPMTQFGGQLFSMQMLNSGNIAGLSAGTVGDHQQTVGIIEESQCIKDEQNHIDQNAPAPSAKNMSPVSETLSTVSNEVSTTNTLPQLSFSLTSQSNVSGLKSSSSTVSCSSSQVSSPTASSGRQRPVPVPISLLSSNDIAPVIASPGFKSASALCPSLTCSLGLPTPFYCLTASSPITLPTPIQGTPMQLVHFWSSLVSPAQPASPNPRMNGANCSSSTTTLFQFPSIPVNSTMMLSGLSDSLQSPLFVPTPTKKSIHIPS